MAPETIEEMAADYLRQIRAVQSQGPYFIGGYSFGGLVAYEMAQQLRRAGQEVGLLVLMDPTSPRFWVPTGSESSGQRSVSRYALALRRHWKNLKELDGKGLAKHLMAALKWRSECLARALKMRLCYAYLEVGRRIPSGLRMFYFFETSEKATEKYMPSPYEGSVALLVAQSRADDSQPVFWQELISGDLRIHELAGDHLDPIVGPQVELWGNRVKESLLHSGIRRSPGCIAFAILNSPLFMGSQPIDLLLESLSLVQM